MSRLQPTILVIVGITGDLARRKLLPAIEQIARAKATPPLFRVVGVTRRPVTLEEVLANPQGEPYTFLAQHLSMVKMDLSDVATYRQLAAHVQSIEQGWGTSAQRLFYLSVPPQISRPIIAHLGESGLHSAPHTKLLMEKPFGTDLSSARELINETRKYFKEEQIYRIDHYQAKEMAQNLIVFREGNSLFKRTWNKDFIEKIEIMAAEKIDIEGRTAFYEQTGALRDLVQSHLLQVAALTLMETPRADSLHEVPGRRLRALQQLHVPLHRPAVEYALRGQYSGYKDAVGNPYSDVETFVRLTLASSDPRWSGVPITLVTGKALNQKDTAIRITYKKDQDYEANELVVRFQPDAGIDLSLWTKVPGYERRLEQHSLKLRLGSGKGPLPEAYEQVFLDAIHSNHTLFTSSDEVLETWKILEPVQTMWQAGEGALVTYEPGSKAQTVGRE